MSGPGDRWNDRGSLPTVVSWGLSVKPIVWVGLSEWRTQLPRCRSRVRRWGRCTAIVRRRRLCRRCRLPSRRDAASGTPRPGRTALGRIPAIKMAFMSPFKSMKNHFYISVLYSRHKTTYEVQSSWKDTFWWHKHTIRWSYKRGMF